MIHILAADAGLDTVSVLNAARTRKPVNNWIVPKGAHVGEQALIHLPARGLAARGVIGTEPRGHGKGRYWATVRKIELLDPAAPLAFLRKHHRSWKWPTYPKSYATIDGRIEARLEELLESKLLKNYTRLIMEGGSKSVRLTVYERSPKARRQCIAHYGNDCYGCGISFGKTYGETAKDYIQVHHLKAVSERGGKKYVVDPVKDLRPICPNCHAVVHLHRKIQTPPLSIPKLKRMLKEARQHG